MAPGTHFVGLSVFFYNLFFYSGGWKKKSLGSLHFHVFPYVSCVIYSKSILFANSASWRVLQFPWMRQPELSLPTATVTNQKAQAAGFYGCVSMSTRLAPWGSGAVEVATQNVFLPGSVELAQAHPLARPPAMRKQLSAGLGPATAHPTHSGVFVGGVSSMLGCWQNTTTVMTSVLCPPLSRVSNPMLA